MRRRAPSTALERATTYNEADHEAPRADPGRTEQRRAEDVRYASALLLGAVFEAARTARVCYSAGSHCPSSLGRYGPRRPPSRTLRCAPFVPCSIAQRDGHVRSLERDTHPCDIIENPALRIVVQRGLSKMEPRAPAVPAEEPDAAIVDEVPSVVANGAPLDIRRAEQALRIMFAQTSPLSFEVKAGRSVGVALQLSSERGTAAEDLGTRLFVPEGLSSSDENAWARNQPAIVVGGCLIAKRIKGAMPPSATSLAWIRMRTRAGEACPRATAA